jgi:hypothetical protein
MRTSRPRQTSTRYWAMLPCQVKCITPIDRDNIVERSELRRRRTNFKMEVLLPCGVSVENFRNEPVAQLFSNPVKLVKLSMCWLSFRYELT